MLAQHQPGFNGFSFHSVQRSLPALHAIPRAARAMFRQLVTRREPGALGAAAEAAPACRTKTIENIDVGDFVWAWDEIAGHLVKRPVKRLFRHKAKHILAVSIASDHDIPPQVIDATTEHPFWVQGKGWVAAMDLNVGDALRGIDGKSDMQVLNVVDSGRKVDVFNFEVDGVHTYFVGLEGVLVHNTSSLDDVDEAMADTVRAPRTSLDDVPPTARSILDGTIDNLRLALSRGGTRPDANLFSPSYMRAKCAWAQAGAALSLEVAGVAPSQIHLSYVGDFVFEPESPHKSVAAVVDGKPYLIDPAFVQYTGDAPPHMLRISDRLRLTETGQRMLDDLTTRGYTPLTDEVAHQHAAAFSRLPLRDRVTAADYLGENNRLDNNRAELGWTGAELNTYFTQYFRNEGPMPVQARILDTLPHFTDRTSDSLSHETSSMKGHTTPSDKLVVTRKGNAFEFMGGSDQANRGVEQIAALIRFELGANPQATKIFVGSGGHGANDGTSFMSNSALREPRFPRELRKLFENDIGMILSQNPEVDISRLPALPIVMDLNQMRQRSIFLRQRALAAENGNSFTISDWCFSAYTKDGGIAPLADWLSVTRAIGNRQLGYRASFP